MQSKIPFDKFFKNISSKPYQISKDKYLEEGQYPIIDQGQKYIIGYSNDNSKIYKIKKPVIIFGDHTRIIKYIDFNFIIGADGTKILFTDDTIFIKYAYYQLLHTKIESLGYSRHYKLLKEKEFIKPPLEQQKQIAKTLDKANELVELRKESITKLDALAKSIFIDMFGDPVSNLKKWKVKKLKELTSKIGSGSTPRGGKDSYKEEGISLIRSLNIHDNRFKYKDLALIDDIQAKSLSNVVVEENDVLLNITGASVCRCTIVPINVLPARVNQHVVIIRTIEDINPKFLLHLFISSYKLKLLNIASSGGATREALTKENLELLEIIVPPIDLQNKFAKIIEKIEEQKSLYTQELEKLQENFDALLQKSFQ
jgi:type I restriction enzyme, S subunit